MSSTDFMGPSDFFECRRNVLQDLNSLISTTQVIEREESRLQPHIHIPDNGSWMTSCCVNLLGLLMICSGGQRPSVYGRLQRPTIEDLEQFQDRKGGRFYWELQTVQEGHQQLDCVTSLPVSYSILDMFQFHVKHVLPILDKTREALTHINPIETNFASRCLFLFSDTGLRLSTVKTTSMFRSFRSKYDRRIANITLPNFRSSYAYLLLLAYKKGTILKDDSKQSFLYFLGKAMNICPEQLQESYGCLMEEGYSTITNAITNTLQLSLRENEDHNELSNGPQVTEDSGIETIFPSGNNEFF